MLQILYSQKPKAWLEVVTEFNSITTGNSRTLEFTTKLQDIKKGEKKFFGCENGYTNQYTFNYGFI